MRYTFLLAVAGRMIPAQNVSAGRVNGGSNPGICLDSLAESVKRVSEKIIWKSSSRGNAKPDDAIFTLPKGEGRRGNLETIIGCSFSLFWWPSSAANQRNVSKHAYLEYPFALPDN